MVPNGVSAVAVCLGFGYGFGLDSDSDWIGLRGHLHSSAYNCLQMYSHRYQLLQVKDIYFSLHGCFDVCPMYSSARRVFRLLCRYSPVPQRSTPGGHPQSVLHEHPLKGITLKLIVSALHLSCRNHPHSRLTYRIPFPRKKKADLCFHLCRLIL